MAAGDRGDEKNSSRRRGANRCGGGAGSTPVVDGCYCVATSTGRRGRVRSRGGCVVLSVGERSENGVHGVDAFATAPDLERLDASVRRGICGVPSHQDLPTHEGHTRRYPHSDTYVNSRALEAAHALPKATKQSANQPFNPRTNESTHLLAEVCSLSWWGVQPHVSHRGRRHAGFGAHVGEHQAGLRNLKHRKRVVWITHKFRDKSAAV